MIATKFLQSVLGDDGAQALSKAADRVPVLGSVLVPRTIVSWLSTAIRINYEGEIPGLDNSYMALQKSRGEGYTGALTIGDAVHQFEDADILHVAAAVGIALGLDDVAVNTQLKPQDLTKLGKSIDLLVKARVVAQAVAEEQLAKFQLSPTKMTQHGAFHVLHTPGQAKPYSVHAADGSAVQHGIADLKSAQTIAGWHARKTLGKQELPGKAAAPRAPEEPEKAIGPIKQPAMNRPPKPPQMSKSVKELLVKNEEASNECSECGLKQFKDAKFVGCMCLRTLAKSAVSKQVTGGYVLSLKRNVWDDDSIQTLISILKG